MKKGLLSVMLLSGLATQAQTTVKKVFLEDYTGAWCGWCPEGTVILEGLEQQYPDVIIPVANHNGDGLQTVEGAAIVAGLSVTSYPNGSIDRKKFPTEAKIGTTRGKWAGYFNQRKAVPAVASVSFTNMAYNATNGTYTADVNVNFSQVPVNDSSDKININVYVLEDGIPATGTIEQDNYSSSVQGGASPLQNWFHNNTLRKALGGAWGFTGVVPAQPVVGTTYTKSVSFKPAPNWKTDNIHLVAFVAFDGKVANDKKEILNSESIHLKAFGGPTAVKEVVQNINVLNAYPNPTAVNQQVKIEYNIQSQSVVDLQVFNVMGQLVAHPYSSKEIAGAHTIQFTPAQYGLAAGMYLMQLNTENGKTSFHLTVR